MNSPNFSRLTRFYVFRRDLVIKFYLFQRLEREKAERLASEKDEELSPEQKLAEKLHRQKLQEESDLKLAMETFGKQLVYF